MIDTAETADSSVIAPSHEPIDRIENAEPTDPIDPMEPMLPIERIDPVLPIDRIDDRDAML